MKIIYNKIIPFKGFIAINLFGILFVREEYRGKISPTIINHESIHTEQMKELLFIFFYIIYGLEWVIRLFIDINHAYVGISFEQEAYSNENNKNYIATRKRFAWWEYMKKPYKK